MHLYHGSEKPPIEQRQVKDKRLKIKPKIVRPHVLPSHCENLLTPLLAETATGAGPNTEERRQTVIPALFH